MFVLKLVVVLGMFSFLTTLAAAQQSQSASGRASQACTPESLVGRYVIIGGEKEGVKEPEERIKGTTVTFTKNKVVVADKEKHEIYSASYTLDTTTNPCDIIMISRVENSAGEIARGLIQKDGETIRLIYALPTGEVPSSFKTKEKQLLFVMKKAPSS